jgi:hypothetical protein
MTSEETRYWRWFGAVEGAWSDICAVLDSRIGRVAIAACAEARAEGRREGIEAAARALTDYRAGFIGDEIREDINLCVGFVRALLDRETVQK